MTARSEIEHRHLYYKRRASCAGYYRHEDYRPRCATSDQAEHDHGFASEEEFIRSTQRPGKRVKSTSVCVGTLQMENERRCLPRPPRTFNDFQFLNPELLTMQNYEIQTIRPPALSTSEVFYEPPPMYIYRVLPAGQSVINSKNHPNKIMEFLKKRKHTLIAWTFGIIAVTVCIVVVVLQSRSDF